jgi:hypothetical protein
VATQPSKEEKLVQSFLTLLATDPKLLVDFIKDPDGVLEQHKIRRKETKDRIRLLLALEVAKQLLVVPTAAFVHW